jgi:uncharacterized protein YbjT (DUF2867 family)
MILITGATGNVGRHLVAGLLAQGESVRALTRDPATANLPPAAELALFDPAQPETLAAALTGTTAVFINPAAVGATIADLMTAASTAGVGRAVLLSSLAVEDDGPQTTSIGAQHKVLEDTVEASTPHWTFLRCGGFATNTLGWATQIRAGDVVRVPYPQASSAPIAEQDIAAAAITVLLNDGHAGTRYVLTGPQSLTQAEQVEAIGAAIGRDLRTEELPLDVFRQAATAHMPAAVVEDLLHYYARYNGRLAQMSPDLDKLLDRPATTFADWATEHAARFS